ncbi:MAG: toll/interleukin-1 receptor domain-containing protein [Bacteroidaceae bacterium]|nr:toll/interleukin-1 receptor domain-containing protein [Bacteroidaceae bacterium]
MRKYKYDIFISYRRSDSTDRAHLVREILKLKGYDENRIFLDTHSIHEGDFSEKISTALMSSKAFILLLSKNSIAENNKVEKNNQANIDYYYEEIKQALALKLKFIPVLFDNIKIEELDFPEEIKNQKIFLKNSIEYHPETFDDKLTIFLQEQKTWRDFFAVPTIILTIYAIITLASGIGMYIYDNFFLSHDTQIETVANNIIVEDGICYYLLPNEIITYNIKNDSISHLNIGSVPTVINAQLNTEQLYGIGFWSVAVGLAYEITKSKVKPHGGKAYITYIATGIAVVAGIGLGCTIERVLYPIQHSRLISENLNDKTFWKNVIRNKYSSKTIRFNR